MKIKHPMQPVQYDGQATEHNPHGVARFKENAIVRYLIDLCSDRKICDMNRLAIMNFTQEDREQFVQLIGYSVAGYNELSYVSDRSALAANEATEKLGATGGCRRKGCVIHGGRK